MVENILINDELRKKIAILGALSKDEVNELSTYLKRKNYSEGEKIYLQDSSPENIYIIEEGEVELTHNCECKSFSLKKFGVGDCFGQIALLGITSNLGDCIALSDVTLLEFSKFDFHRLSKINNKLFTKLLLNITREICRYNCYLTNKFIEKLESDVV